MIDTIDVKDYTNGGKCSNCGRCCSNLLPLSDGEIKASRSIGKAVSDMARYIDADALIKKIYPMGIGDGMYTINAKAVKFAIDNTPNADVVPSERLKNAMKLLDKTEDELYEVRGEVEKLTVELEAMRGAAKSYKMHYENLAREIFKDIEREIKDALKSNYNAKSERLKSPCVDMADEFVGYCEGKIDALRGIQNFIDKLKEKYGELK